MKKLLISILLPATLFATSCATTESSSSPSVSSSGNTREETPKRIGVSATAPSREKGNNGPDPFGLMTCSTPTESRTMAVAKKAEGGCELHYEKYGRDKVISWSTVSVDPCMRSREKVQKELEAAGWKCIQE